MQPTGILRYVYWALAAVLPWSMDLPVWPGASAHLWFPGELLIAFLSVLLFWYRPFKINQLVIFSALWLLWGWGCAAVSSDVLVSVKYMLVTTAFWWVFMFPASKWALITEEVLPIFSMSMALLVIRFLVVYGYWFHFRTDQALLPALPFFDDHNALAAVSAFLIFLVGVARPQHRYWRPVRAVIIVILAAGVVVSTSRGGMLSVLGSAFLVAQFLYWKGRILLKTVVFTGSALLLVWFVAGPAIRSTAVLDVSMMERMNRYECAVEMGKERPITGFGPGTFAVTYIPFQRPESRTRISVNKPITGRTPENYGRGGGAHSEYLQALGETGWPGMVFLCLIWGILLVKATDGIKFEQKKRDTVLLLGALFTFLIHGWLNNFFHDPRMAFLVWVCAGKIFDQNADQS